MDEEAFVSRRRPLVPKTRTREPLRQRFPVTPLPPPFTSTPPELAGLQLHLKFWTFNYYNPSGEGQQHRLAPRSPCMLSFSFSFLSLFPTSRWSQNNPVSAKCCRPIQTCHRNSISYSISTNVLANQNRSSIHSIYYINIYMDHSEHHTFCNVNYGVALPRRPLPCRTLRTLRCV